MFSLPAADGRSGFSQVDSGVLCLGWSVREREGQRSTSVRPLLSLSKIKERR